MMEGMRISGEVKWFNSKKGYGFIIGPNNEDVFVHYSYIDASGYRTLTKGQEVMYSLVQTDRGPQAHNVSVAL